MAQVRVNVTLQNGSRSVDVVALHDDGADAFAFIDPSIATQLGLTLGGSISFSGVTGGATGFNSTVSKITVKENPDCSVVNAPVIVGPVSVPNVSMLLGQHFMQSVNMVTTINTDGTVTLGCKKGPSIAISEPIPPEYYILAGAGLIALFAIFWLGRS